jgi:hypothetical protein
MGGYGSGRRTTRACTDEMCRLDVRPLTRQGLLHEQPWTRLYWGPADAPRFQLTLALSEASVLVSSKNLNHEEWQHTRYEIALDWTECPYGGKRAWWRCPAPGCGRRVAVLYGQPLFTCRQCCDLSYGSQRQSAANRANRNANKVRRRLGWTPGIASPDGPKPKGMHWSTFWALKHQHDLFAFSAILPWHERMRQLQANLPALRAGLLDG